MTVTGKDIIEDAAELLFDKKYTRWTMPELCRWLNSAQRDIVLHKPGAKSATRYLRLEAGTKQSLLPVENSGNVTALLEIFRNVTETAAVPPETEPTYSFGRSISVTSRKILDREQPNWHNSRHVRYKDEVRQYTYDENNPYEFFVYPGNTGNGMVEVLVSEIPADLVATGDVNLIASYGANISLPDIYAGPLLDFVLYRAFSKDNEGQDVVKSETHYRKYAQSMGMKVRVEGGNSPNMQRVTS